MTHFTIDDELLTHQFNNEWRFLVILEDSGTLNVVPEDSLEDLEGEFFDKLRAAPNYKMLNLVGYGKGMFILADPYCERELSKQIYAFANDCGRVVSPLNKYSYLHN
jgi:hypothetical protein